MSTTVGDPAAEREPDRITPCWACNGSGQNRVGGDDLEYEVFECTACGGTGLPAVQRNPDGLDDADDFCVIGSKSAGWNGVNGWVGSTPDEVPVCLAASRHGGICGQPAPCDGSRHVEPEPVSTERRTVSLEVLTDELRQTFDVFGVRGPLVGVVLRVNGEPIDVPEVHTLWAAPFRQPADVLAKMLEQGRNYASGIDGQAGAELLMPTPDVLAALAGTPDAQLLTAPVWVLAMDVTPGMLLAPEVDLGEQLVTARPSCTRADCVYGSCAVTVTADGEQHQSGYARIRVRIPAVVTA